MPVEKLSLLPLDSVKQVVVFSSLHNRNSTQKSTGSAVASPVIHPLSLLRLHKCFWFSSGLAASKEKKNSDNTYQRYQEYWKGYRIGFLHQY